MKRLVAALLPVLALPLLAAEDRLPAEADALLREGIRFYDKGDYPAAMDRLSEALLRRPGDPRAQSYILMTGEKLADMDDRLKSLKTADLERMIDRARAVLRRRKEEMDAALQKLKAAYERSRAQDPTSLLKACRGVDIMLEVSLGDDEESGEVKRYLHSLCGNLEESVRAGLIAAEADARRVAGYIAFCRSDWRAAAEEWRKALALTPGDKRLAFLLERAEENHARALGFMESARLVDEAESLRAAGRVADAIPLLEEALRIDSANKKALFLIEDWRSEARHEARRKAVDEHRRRALGHRKAGRWLEAARSWLDVLEIDPAHEEARGELARMKAALSEDPAGPAQGTRDAEGSQKQYALGLVEYTSGRLEDALRRFEESLRLDPSNDYAGRAAARVREELEYKR